MARGVIPRFTAVEIGAMRALLRSLSDLGWLRTESRVFDLPKGVKAAARRVLRKLEE